MYRVISAYATQEFLAFWWLITRSLPKPKGLKLEIWHVVLPSVVNLWIVWCLLSAISYVDKTKCKQWRQQRFAHSFCRMQIAGGALKKKTSQNPGSLFARSVICFTKLFQVSLCQYFSWNDHLKGLWNPCLLFLCMHNAQLFLTAIGTQEKKSNINY